MKYQILWRDEYGGKWVSGTEYETRILAENAAKTAFQQGTTGNEYDAYVIVARKTIVWRKNRTVCV